MFYKEQRILTIGLNPSLSNQFGDAVKLEIKKYNIIVWQIKKHILAVQYEDIKMN